MTFLVERLVELRRHLDHLDAVAPRVQDRRALERDLSLHNDVLFSLLMVSQLVIDIAGELSARRGDRFEDYTEAIPPVCPNRVITPSSWVARWRRSVYGRKPWRWQDSCARGRIDMCVVIFAESTPSVSVD